MNDLKKFNVQELLLNDNTQIYGGIGWFVAGVIASLAAAAIYEGFGGIKDAINDPYGTSHRN